MRRRLACPAVTDHAVVRYLERVFGVDVEGLRGRIRREAAVAVLHGAEAVRRGGVIYRLREGSVVTVETTEGKQRRVRRMRAGG